MQRYLAVHCSRKRKVFRSKSSLRQLLAAIVRVALGEHNVIMTTVAFLQEPFCMRRYATAPSPFPLISPSLLLGADPAGRNSLSLSLSLSRRRMTY